VLRWSSTAIEAGKFAGSPPNNCVSAMTPPAEAPMTMTSRFVRSRLTGFRRFDRCQSNCLFMLLDGMCGADHVSNGEDVPVRIATRRNSPGRRAVQGRARGCGKKVDEKFYAGFGAVFVAWMDCSAYLFRRQRAGHDTRQTSSSAATGYDVRLHRKRLATPDHRTAECHNLSSMPASVPY
jgi:hypothetical protein